MKLYVGKTDHDWFEHVKRARPVEVNFWRPKDTRKFRSLAPGDLFLFKLHKEHGGLVVGGGYFMRHWVLTAKVAWDSFGPDNGAATEEEFYRRLGLLGGKGRDREIGCIVLAEPFALEHPFDIPTWPPSTVQGKGYDLTSSEGMAIFQTVRDQSETIPDIAQDRVAQIRISYDEPARGPLRTVQTRIGQGQFRLRTLENYERTCCVTGEHTLPALEAAHILPVAQHGHHRLDNGLCLRAAVHRLFDNGLISITPEYRIVVSPLIRDLYLNGRPYYTHDGAKLRALPAVTSDQPNREALATHVEKVFRRG